MQETGQRHRDCHKYSHIDLPQIWFDHQLEAREDRSNAVYRHKNSSKALDNRRLPSGKISIKLPPSCGDNQLNVVDKYKHLGGMITVTGNMTPEMEHRASSALQAFTPLATRIFGSVHVPTHLKMSFVQSLIYCRLFLMPMCGRLHQR